MEVLRSIICAAGVTVIAVTDKVDGKYCLAALVAIAIPTVASKIADLVTAKKTS